MVNILLSKYNFYEDWIYKYLEEYINEDSNVVVIPFSFSEEWISNDKEWQESYSKNGGKYHYEIVYPFVEFDVKQDNIKWMNYFTHSKEEMILMIKESDILFFTGGLPEKAVEKIVNKGLLETIKNYDKVIMGASAGALIQLENYHVSPDDKYEEFKYFEGLGLIKDNFYVEVHYDPTNKDQERSIIKVLNERSNKIYALTDKGGIIVDGGNIKALGSIIVYENKEEVVDTDI